MSHQYHRGEIVRRPFYRGHSHHQRHSHHHRGRHERVREESPNRFRFERKISPKNNSYRNYRAPYRDRIVQRIQHSPRPKRRNVGRPSDHVDLERVVPPRNSKSPSERTKVKRRDSGLKKQPKQKVDGQVKRKEKNAIVKKKARRMKKRVPGDQVETLLRSGKTDPFRDYARKTSREYPEERRRRSESPDLLDGVEHYRYDTPVYPPQISRSNSLAFPESLISQPAEERRNMEIGEACVEGRMNLLNVMKTHNELMTKMQGRLKKNEEESRRWKEKFHKMEEENKRLKRDLAKWKTQKYQKHLKNESEKSRIQNVSVNSQNPNSSSKPVVVSQNKRKRKKKEETKRMKYSEVNERNVVKHIELLKSLHIVYPISVKRPSKPTTQELTCNLCKVFFPTLRKNGGVGVKRGPFHRHFMEGDHKNKWKVYLEKNFVGVPTSSPKSSHHRAQQDEHATKEVQVVGELRKKSRFCPILQLPITRPVKNRNCVHIYDKEGIVFLKRTCRKRDGKIVCPYPGCNAEMEEAPLTIGEETGWGNDEQPPLDSIDVVEID